MCVGGNVWKWTFELSSRIVPLTCCNCHRLAANFVNSWTKEMAHPESSSWESWENHHSGDWSHVVLLHINSLDWCFQRRSEPGEKVQAWLEESSWKWERPWQIREHIETNTGRCWRALANNAWQVTVRSCTAQADTTFCPVFLDWQWCPCEEQGSEALGKVILGWKWASEIIR